MIKVYPNFTGSHKNNVASNNANLFDTKNVLPKSYKAMPNMLGKDTVQLQALSSYGPCDGCAGAA